MHTIFGHAHLHTFLQTTRLTVVPTASFDFTLSIIQAWAVCHILLDSTTKETLYRWQKENTSVVLKIKKTASGKREGKNEVRKEQKKGNKKKNKRTN